MKREEKTNVMRVLDSKRLNTKVITMLLQKQ